MGAKLETVESGLKLLAISNRGVNVYPGGNKNTLTSDQWCCRYMGNGTIAHTQIVELLGKLAAAGYDFIKTEHLYNFDGKAGFTMSQGQ